MCVVFTSMVEEEKEKAGEGGFIACEGIEHSQGRLLRWCIPCHADVVGDLVRRVAAPATKTKFYWTDFLILPDLSLLPSCFSSAFSCFCCCLVVFNGRQK